MMSRFITCLLLLFVVTVKLNATHIVGGEMTYSYKGNNYYDVKLRLYIDCFNGNQDAIAQDLYANFTVFEGDSGKLIPSLCKSVLRTSPVRVSKTNYNCIKISPNACVDAYDYVTTMELPPIKGGYYISYQRCCRNNTIVNIISPLSTGENIWTKINDTTDIGFNSSPEFKNLPPNFLCTNAPLVFDHSATDGDGDSLVYEFFHPYTGGTTGNPRPECSFYVAPPFPKILFESSYSYSLAIPSTPVVNLNSSTGILKITPTLPGQFVVGIVVKEYRKGKLIGATQRDYQFNVQNCVFETTSAFVNPSVNCNREVFFTNNSQNADTYNWDFGDSTTINDTSSNKDAYYRYPKPGSYRVRLLAAKGNCLDSIVKIVTVFDRINFRLPPDTTICRGLSAVVQPDSFYRNSTYLWNTGSTDTFIKVSSPGQYVLNVKLGNCSSNDTILVAYDDLNVVIDADSLYCSTVTFELESILQVRGRYKTVNWEAKDVKLKPPTNDSILMIHKRGHYYAYGINQNNCPYSDTIDVEAPDLSKYIKVPNVFTPGNDQFNDFFPAEKLGYEYKLVVFDRWGVKVHDSANIPWDAGVLPAGTYYYFIEINACDYELKTHGVVHVIR